MDTVNRHSLSVNILKLGFCHPFPRELVKEFIKDLEKVIVIEEVEPVMEKEILSLVGEKGWCKKIHGKLDKTLPRIYEYNPDIVDKALTQIFQIKKIGENPKIDFEGINPPARPPVLCPGCPHRSTIYGLKKAVQSLKIKKENIIYSNDIGCYTLALQPPYHMADYVICMGSSIGIASGMSKSTRQKLLPYRRLHLFHAGIPPLINAVYQKANIMVVIMDNANCCDRWTTKSRYKSRWT